MASRIGAQGALTARAKGVPRTGAAPRASRSRNAALRHRDIHIAVKIPPAGATAEGLICTDTLPAVCVDAIPVVGETSNQAAPSLVDADAWNATGVALLV